MEYHNKKISRFVKCIAAGFALLFSWAKSLGIALC